MPLRLNPPETFDEKTQMKVGQRFWFVCFSDNNFDLNYLTNPGTIYYLNNNNKHCCSRSLVRSHLLITLKMKNTNRFVCQRCYRKTVYAPPPGKFTKLYTFHHTLRM